MSAQWSKGYDLKLKKPTLGEVGSDRQVFFARLRRELRRKSGVQPVIQLVNHFAPV